MRWHSAARPARGFGAGVVLYHVPSPSADPPGETVAASLHLNADTWKRLSLPSRMTQSITLRGDRGTGTYTSVSFAVAVIVCLAMHAR